jgi:secreted trypsin-like serine protease
LSAANCVDRGEATDYQVATVADDRKHLKIGKRIQVSKVTINPAYSPAYADHLPRNDIAILELEKELPPPFATISAQRSADPKAGAIALVGAIDFRSEPGTLLQSSVAIWDDATCAAKTELRGSALEEIMCAGSEHGGAGACPGTGSAGGALAVLSGEGRKYQVGVVSAATDCSAPEAAYGVYTRISSYTDWIKQVAPDALIEPVTGR